ncbi:MAG TPA: hypothetical protein PK156_45550, partial [Polyangium sp.]|nr:hypothetical protein [Polyangium sp.]
VFAAMLCRLLESAPSSAVLVQMLQDPDVRARLLGHPVARGVIAALVGGFCSTMTLTESDWFVLREQLLQSNTNGVHLPDGVTDWLAKLKREEVELAATLPIVHELVSRGKQLSQRKIYENWDGGRHFEQEKRKYFDERLDAILTTKSPTPGGIALMRAEDWIRTTHRALVERQARTKEPDGDGRRRIIDMFREFEDILGLLQKLRPADGQTTLADLLAIEASRTLARSALMEWLSTQDHTAELRHLVGKGRLILGGDSL